MLKQTPAAVTRCYYLCWLLESRTVLASKYSWHRCFHLFFSLDIIASVDSKPRDLLYSLWNRKKMSARPVVKTSTMTSAQMQEFAIVAAQVGIVLLLLSCLWHLRLLVYVCPLCAMRRMPSPTSPRSKRSPLQSRQSLNRNTPPRKFFLWTSIFSFVVMHLLLLSALLAVGTALWAGTSEASSLTNRPSSYIFTSVS